MQVMKTFQRLNRYDSYLLGSQNPPLPCICPPLLALSAFLTYESDVYGIWPALLSPRLDMTYLFQLTCRPPFEGTLRGSRTAGAVWQLDCLLAKGF